ncbi:hypothetical protein XENTR_v10010177 [Xenopus tropicalis]|uniref:Provisional ortholog of transmembrane 4 L six family member 5 n=1 Tax=Xenopus tropicalis TaxID=8364 RepID=F6SU87_XENTR|nr:transmembrane 4 L6 family member 5 [Xenopus tropicalis]KAE8620292.1 hypothetical protein XENTR_v10010177 [Xenopus tropicalis]KAE8620293.1 hypothetical protein XENTR_v10010177 [Xenopus tropicalis]KAE8620294.1 hypothetical protein XENTR_v10010177 [Xenopus tropicalis]|eukprot:XP_002941283.1 PREDICTED: transmembrane 4 L6 family member 5-like [Xenopus tropicalis]
MCTGKCSKVVGISLFPFSIICIIANLFLLFPGLSIDPIQDASQQMTPEVLYLGGVIGGGFLVLIPAIHILSTGQKENCCNNRCGMFLSIIFAVIGLVGAVYALAVSALGMVYGPVCEYPDPKSGNLTWGQPFKDNLEKFSNESYLFNKDQWYFCEKPDHVAPYNITLFSIILAASGVEVILCVIQVINGLAGCICGTCQKKN